MATRRQQNWLGQLRVDVSDLRAIDSGVTADFDILAGKIMAGRQPLVVRGFTISTTNAAGNSAEQLQLSVASGLLLHFGASESGTIFMVEDGAEAETLSATNPKVRGGFIANSINYVGLDLIRSEDPLTSDLKQFLDADTKLEIPKTVPVARTLDYNIVISTQPFSISTNICPIAKVETNTNNNVTAITDSRNLMFRLGSGGDSPNALDSFTWPDSTRRENNQYFSPPTTSTNPFIGGDKEIVSFKEWMDAVMTRIWEIGSGEYWYRPNNRDAVKLVCAQPVFVSTQDNWEWNSGTNTLAWTSLLLAFENSTVYFNNISDGSAVLSADGQCLYIDLQRDSSASFLVPAVATLVELGTPTTPGSRFILAWRIGGQIYVRDRGFEVGRAHVVATTSVLGIVKLSRAATTPLAPIVLADSERNATDGVAGLSAALSVYGTGLSRDTVFAAGAISVGTGTNDSSVSIAKSATETNINGNLKVKGDIDTIAASAMTIGTSQQSSLSIGKSASNTDISGNALTVTAAGILTIDSTDEMFLTGVDNINISSGNTINLSGPVVGTNNISIPNTFNFRYTAAKSLVLHIDGSAFVGNDSLNNPIATTAGSWMGSNSTVGGTQYSGRVPLPYGATVTGISFLASNNDAVAIDVGTRVSNLAYNSGGSYTATEYASGTTYTTSVANGGGSAWYPVTLTGNFSVSDDGYLSIHCTIAQTTSINQLYVKAYRITYTMTNLAPNH